MIGLIFGFLKNSIPWKDVIFYLVIGVALYAVFSYIKNAEDNRSKVVNLTSANVELAKANADLEAEYKKRIQVLQEAAAAEREREKDYAENIKIIRSGPDGSCARNSSAIANSLRMRLERASDKAE